MLPFGNVRRNVSFKNMYIMMFLIYFSVLPASTITVFVTEWESIIVS